VWRVEIGRRQVQQSFTDGDELCLHGVRPEQRVTQITLGLLSFGEEIDPCYKHV
jgi:hypothetical protein